MTSYLRTYDDVIGTYKCSKCENSYDETNEYIWSDWSNEKADDVSNDLIEEKTLYRYSVKETTESDKDSLDGWTKYKSEITDWTSWLAWQNSSVTASESKEVKTQYIKPTYKTVWHYSRDTGNGYSTYAIGYYGNPEYITLNYRLTAKGTADGYTRYGSYGTYLADYWWNESSESVVDKAGYTQYSYRDAIYTHYYYKWSDMSDWQETPVEQNENTTVETSTVYRYKITPLEREVNEPTVDVNAPQIVVENTSVLAGNQVRVAVNIKNNPGFSYLELTPKYSSALELVSVENGVLVSDLTKGRQYIWVADSDVSDDDLLMTFVFNIPETTESGDYDVSFIFRSAVNYDEQDVEFTVVGETVSVLDFKYGDANGDNIIDGKDVVRIKKYLANFDYDTNTSTTEISLGADANGDGVVDGKDVVRLKKYLASYDYETDSSTVVLGPQN